MPKTTITIDRDQRAGLYELIRNHLGSIEDFWIALERTRDYAKAEQLVSSAAAALGVNRRTIASRLRTVERYLGRPLGACAEMDAALRLDELSCVPAPRAAGSED